MCMQIHALTDACTHKYMHIQTHAHTTTCACRYMHLQTHAQINTCAYKHTNTCTQTNTLTEYKEGLKLFFFCILAAFIFVLSWCDFKSCDKNLYKDNVIHNDLIGSHVAHTTLFHKMCCYVNRFCTFSLFILFPSCLLRVTDRPACERNVIKQSSNVFTLWWRCSSLFFEASHWADEICGGRSLLVIFLQLGTSRKVAREILNVTISHTSFGCHCTQRVLQRDDKCLKNELACV